jgi:hypothetical protein
VYHYLKAEQVIPSSVELDEIDENSGSSPLGGMYTIGGIFITVEWD